MKSSLYLFLSMGSLFFCLSLSLSNSLYFNVIYNFFLLDSMSIYLSIISLSFIMAYLSICNCKLSLLESFCLTVSIFFSLFCFFSKHFLGFWMSYELTIVPLLICLFSCSPYSERFLAGWYLLFYVLTTGLPMLLALWYNSFYTKSSYMSSMDVKKVSFGVFALLFMLFITKIPLPPFHSWLPVVHAEASTFVSICLSGYVMKLGLMGVIRFCSSLMSELKQVIFLMFGFSLLFYATSFSELDTKRWLAFLSLVHILVSVVGLYTLHSYNISVSVFYCLGHGMSAGVLFYLFSFFYEASGSRKWSVIMKAKKISKMWRLLVAICLLTVVSFPPSISFLSELFMLKASLKKILLIFLFSFYLFFSGIGPVILFGYFLVNNNLVGFSFNHLILPLFILFSLCFLWFSGKIFL